MDVARDFQRFADRADAAVHHVARRDDVGAGFGMRQRLLHQRVDGDVVHDVAGVVDDAVLTVRRVRIQRDVGDDAELRHRLLDRTHGALRESFRIPGLAAVQALGVGGRAPGTAPAPGCRARASCSASRTSSSIGDPLDARACSGSARAGACPR